MKTKGLIYIITVLASTWFILAESQHIYAQKIESLKTFTLPKTASQGDLVSFYYDEPSGNFKVIYSIGSKKEILLETFLFDKEMNFISSETSSDMTPAETQKLYPYYDFESKKVMDEGTVRSDSRKLKAGEITTDNGSGITYEYEITKENFKLVKKNGDAVEFEKNIPFSEFAEKLTSSPEGKAGKPCSEKSNKFVIAGHYVEDNGDIFILGQNRNKGGMMGVMQWQQEGHVDAKYKDCFIFHFDDQGNLLSQYSFDTKWIINDSPCEQYLFEGASGEHTYWMILNNFYETIMGAGFTYFKPIICQINKTDHSMGTLFNGQKELGIKEFKYLDPMYPFIELEKGTLVFLGKDRAKGSGKKISFVKMTLE